MIFFPRRNKAEEPDSSFDEEAALLERAKNNPADFMPVYELYFSRIYSYCRYRLSQPEEAEDVTSLIFTRALAGLDTYRGGSVAAWLFKIAHNAVANHLRSRRPQVSLEVAVTSGWTDHLAAPGDETLEKLVQLEEREQLASLIATLPAEQRELLSLSIAGQLTAKEVGQVLGKSEGAIWTAFHRIVQRLKAEYRRQEEDDNHR